MAILRRNTVFVNIWPIFLVWRIQLFTPNPNFPLDFNLFKVVKKKKLSEYFWASFWDSLFFWGKKREGFNEFHWKYFKATWEQSLAVVAHIEEKHIFFFNICHIYLVWRTQLFTSNPNFSLDFNFSNLLRKKIFWVFLTILLWNHFFD